MPQTGQFTASDVDQPKTAGQFTAADIDQTPQKRTLGDAASDFLGEFWKQVNPVAGIKGLAQAVGDPINTYKNDASARQAIYDKAEDAFKNGDYTEGAAHLLHAFIPFVGPQLDAAANNFLQWNYAKGAGASVGLGANLVAPELVGKSMAALRTSVAPALQSTAEDLYQSALKPAPAKYTPGEVSNLVNTGLSEKVPVSQGGLDKISGLIGDLNDAVKNEIASQPGKTVNSFDVASRLQQTAKKFQTQVNPTADLNAIRESGADFLQNQPTDIPAAQAQELKTGTYQQLSSRAYGELGSATVEAQKALARGLKEELANAFPEIADLNARESKLYGLDEAMERAVNRIGNHQIIGIGTPIAMAGAKAVTGSSAAAGAIGVMRAVLDNPMLKSKLAIVLSNKAKLAPAVAMSRIDGYVRALGTLGNPIEQEQPSADMQLATAQ